MGEIRQLQEEILDAKRAIQDFSDSINQQLETAKKNTEKLIDREKVINRDKFHKQGARLDTCSQRLDKDSEQLLRQSNEINDLNINLRGNLNRIDRLFNTFEEKFDTNDKKV